MNSKDIQNRKENGRINIGSGEKYSTSISVSPSNKDFLDNIEEKIRGVVLALILKGYMTLSSCESHKVTDRRNVIIIFNKKRQLFKFLSDLRKFRCSKFLYYNVITPSDYMEFAEEYKPEYDDIHIRRKEGISLRQKMSNQECIDSLNKLFDKNYDNYILLDLIICPSSDDIRGGIVGRLSIWLFRRLGGMRFVTKKLEKFIETELPVYED